jgi:hypothetical protein
MIIWMITYYGIRDYVPGNVSGKLETEANGTATGSQNKRVFHWELGIYYYMHRIMIVMSIHSSHDSMTPPTATLSPRLLTTPTKA